MDTDDLGNLSSVVTESHVIRYHAGEDESGQGILSSSVMSPVQVTSQEDHAYVDQDPGLHVTDVEVVDSSSILLEEDGGHQLRNSDNLVPVILTTQQQQHGDTGLVELINVDPATHPDLSNIESALDGSHLVSGTLEQSILSAQRGQVQLVEENELHRVVLVTPSSDDPGRLSIPPPPPLKRHKPVSKTGGQETSYVFALGETPLRDETRKRKIARDASLTNSSSKKQTEAGSPVLFVDLGEEENEEESGTDISQAWFTTRDDKVALQSKGHQWRQGQWSREEVERLQHNIALYCQERDMEDPTDIIFNMSKDERKDFYRTVAKGLQRPLFSVYRRVIRMYDRKNHIGKYLPNEIHLLKRLREQHGTDWATIGAALGRSASSVKDRCRLMRETCNSGKWLPEEEKRLAQAVYDLSGVPPGEPVTQGLSWSMVSEKVASRTEKQCRTKWLNYLNWKHSGGVEWTRDDDLQLIRRLTEMGVTDDTQVDWTDLASEMKSARSPQWLRGKWWSIKRHVPNYQQRTLTDVLKHLKQMGTMDIRTKLPISATLNAAANFDQHQHQHNITLAIPVNSLGEQVHGMEEREIISTTKAGEYEILQGMGAVTSSQQLVLTQGSNSTISISSGAVAGEHIILHMLPISQTDGDESAGGHPGVELNPQIIISNSAAGTDGVQVYTERSQGDLDATSTSQAAMDMHLVGQTLIADHNHPDLQALNEVDVISHYVDVHPGMAVEENMASHTQLIADHNVFQKSQEASLHVIVPEEEGEETAPSVTLDTGSHDNTNLIHNMSSLTDPMLTSDLICSTTDMEGEKAETGNVDSDSAVT